jgi:hypothetical protein
MHVYEVRPRKIKRGVGLISDALRLADSDNAVKSFLIGGWRMLKTLRRKRELFSCAD